MFRLSKILSLKKFVLILAICAGVLGAGAMQVQASKSDLVTVAADRQKNDPMLILTQGMAEIVDVEGDIADIMVANPEIVEVSALQSNRLYLVGMNVGSTNLIAVDEAGNIVKRLNVHVKIDDAPIKQALKDLFPDEDVTLTVLTDQMILSGTVSTPDKAQKIANVVAHYMGEIQDMEGTVDYILANLLTVRGESQVMLRVKVMEVSRTLLKERGTDTNITDIGGLLGDEVRNSADPNLSGLFGGVIQTGVTETPFAAFGLLESIGAFGPLDSVITLLEEEGLARILAEPNLSAVSGEQASFLAGGEFPVPSGVDDQGNISVTFRPFGVALNFRPIVMSEDRISLQLETEVSSLSRENQVTLATIEVPGLDVRRANTTVEMGSGSTLMIAGLLQSSTVDNLSGIPGMTRTPIISQLMSSQGFRREETEMVVLVTPYLVSAFADKNNAKKIPNKQKENNELATAFHRNISRTFGKTKTSELFEGNQSFGYLID